jgi:hypothetical protein
MASIAPKAANGARGAGALDAEHPVVFVDSLTVQVSPEHDAATATEIVIFDVTTRFTAVTQSVRLSPTST